MTDTRELREKMIEKLLELGFKNDPGCVSGIPGQTFFILMPEAAEQIADALSLKGEEVIGLAYREPSLATGSSVLEEIDGYTAEDKAAALLKHKGWKPNDKLHLHGVVQLMVEFAKGFDPGDHQCSYPACGCDFDAICNVEVGRREALASQPLDPGGEVARDELKTEPDTPAEREWMNPPEGPLEAMMLALARAHDEAAEPHETGAETAVRAANGIACPYWEHLADAALRLSPSYGGDWKDKQSAARIADALEHAIDRLDMGREGLASCGIRAEAAIELCQIAQRDLAAMLSAVPGGE